MKKILLLTFLFLFSNLFGGGLNPGDTPVLGMCTSSSSGQLITYFSNADGTYKKVYNSIPVYSQIAPGDINTNSCSTVDASLADSIWYYSSSYNYYVQINSLNHYKKPSLSYYHCFREGFFEQYPSNSSATEYNTCLSNQPVPCTANQHLDTTSNTCVSDPGYHMDGNNSVPDVTCPSSMKYKYVAMPSYQFDIKTCVPDTNISKADCLSKGGEWANSSYNIWTMSDGVGCFDRSYYLNKSASFAVGFNPYGALSSNPDLLSTFIHKIFGYGKSKLFGLGKGLWSKVSTLLDSSSSNLGTSEPDVINMSMSSNGVYYDVNLNTKTPDPASSVEPTRSWSDIYHKWVKNGWDFPQAPNDVSPDVPDFKINRPNFPTAPKPDLYYKGDDVTTFNDSDIGSANLASSGTVPDVSSHLSEPLNTQFQTSVNVAPDVLSTSAPVQLQTDLLHYSHSTNLNNDIADVFKGKIRYPDGTSSDIVINRTQYPDGSGVNDIHLSHKITTDSSSKTLNTNYQTTFDSSGNAVTTLNDPSSVVSVDSSGNSVVSTNQGTSSLDTSTNPSSINLEPISSRLDKIDTTIKDIVNYTPEVATEANANLNSFDQAFNAFDVNFGDYKNFLSGIVTNINDISTQFADTKNLLENKPTIQQINGTCGFDVSLYGKSNHVDICAFVAPYRPILSSIFTLFMSLAVIAFAFKFLFKD